MNWSVQVIAIMIHLLPLHHAMTGGMQPLFASVSIFPAQMVDFAEVSGLSGLVYNLQNDFNNGKPHNVFNLPHGDRTRFN